MLSHATRIEALEGNWTPNRIVLIEIEDAEPAKQWWTSPAYAEVRAIHRAASTANITLVNGADRCDVP